MPGASARSWAMRSSLRDLPDGSSRRSGGGAPLDLAFSCSPFLWLLLCERFYLACPQAASCLLASSPLPRVLRATRPRLQRRPRASAPPAPFSFGGVPSPAPSFCPASLVPLLPLFGSPLLFVLVFFLALFLIFFLVLCSASDEFRLGLQL
eukprot:5893385-Pyramimonas_sp.AAC.1